MTQDDIARRLDILEGGIEACGLKAERRLDAAIQLYVNTADTCILLTLALLADRDRLVCYGANATRVPEHRRRAVAELVARINRAHIIGGFDLDFADGELRYRIGHILTDQEPTYALVDNLVGYTVGAWDRCHQALMSVAYGNMAPEAALARIQAIIATAAASAPTESDDDPDDDDDKDDVPDTDIDTILDELGLG